MYGDELATEEIMEKDRKYTIRGFGRYPIVIENAEGAKFWDTEGEEYIDFFSQTAGVLAVGHSNQEIIEATKYWLDKIQHSLTMFANPPRAVLSEKLAKIAPGSMKDNCMHYFACGGTEANEGALKAAMNITGRNEVISTYHSYHGASLSTLSLMGQAIQRNREYPEMGGFSQVPRPDAYRAPDNVDPEEWDTRVANRLEEHINYGTSNNIAAFISEPISGSGGHHMPETDAWHKRTKEICEEYGILYISDEVQTGFGRTGEMFGIENFSVTPDIMTTAKALGGGVPISAFSINKDVLSDDQIEYLQEEQWHIFTYGGSPPLAAAACAAIDYVVDNDLPTVAQQRGDYMKKRLKELEEEYKFVGDVRGEGLFLGVELVKDPESKEKAPDLAAEVWEACMNDGLLFGVNEARGQGNVLKFKPPIEITEDEIDDGIEIIDEHMRQLTKREVTA